MSQHSSATLAKWADKIEAALRPHASGLSKVQVMNLTGLGESTVNKALRFAFQRGGVFWIRTLYAATWYHARFKAAHDAHLKQRTLTRNEQKSAKRKRDAEKAVNDFERQPVQVLVPAHLAQPIRPAGPASVWDLAA